MSEESSKGVTKRIREKAYEIINERRYGIRYSELVDKLQRENPTFNPNTIYAQVSDLRNHKDYKNKLAQINRIYITTENEKNINSSDNSAEEPEIDRKTPREEEFYKKFADFLRDDLGECNVAKPYGNSKNALKWGTPDVVGYSDIKMTSSFKRDPELVAGELKAVTKSADLITAFGQAAAYLLFCHRSYIAVPQSSKPDDLNRLESLCILFGIGLLLFDNKDPSKVQFKIRNRSQRHEPDIVQLNNFGGPIIDFLNKKQDE